KRPADDWCPRPPVGEPRWGDWRAATIPPHLDVTPARGEYDNRRSHLHPLVEVDHVLVGHADAAGRYGLTDILRLVGAMDAVERVLAPLVQVDRPRAPGICPTAVHDCPVRAKPHLAFPRPEPTTPL